MTQEATSQAAVKAQHWTENLAKWIAVMVGVSSLAFGVAQFMEAKNTWRLQRTTPYFDRYESGQIGDARRKLASSLKSYESQFNQISGPGVTAGDREAMLAGIFTSDPVVSDSFDVVADFFQGMRVCIEVQLCDSTLSDRYFSNSDADDLWALGRPYVRLRRVNNASYASAFESFVKAKGDASPMPSPRSALPHAASPAVEPTGEPESGAPERTHRPGVTVPAPIAPLSSQPGTTGVRIP